MRYDGTVNLPYRKFSVMDQFGSTLPYYGGFDSDFLKDKYQDFVSNQRFLRLNDLVTHLNALLCAQLHVSPTQDG